MTLASDIMGSFSLIQYGEFFLRILVAVLCGGLIGYERSKRLKEAGVRTHIIVCSAAALMMIISKYGFGDLYGYAGADGFMDGVRGADPARVAAQIVSGVSFLGVGVIFHNGNTVKGLTTAAGIWATAGIGMAIGTGLYPLGLFLTLIIFVVQLLMHKIEIGGDALYTSSVKFTIKNTDDFRDYLENFVEENRIQIMESEIDFDENGYVTYKLTLRTPMPVTIDGMQKFLSAKSEVKSISCLSMN